MYLPKYYLPSRNPMEQVIMKIPMVVLTWLAGFWAWLIVVIDGDLLSKGFVMVTGLCTLIVALIKWRTEKQNQKAMEETQRKIARMEFENELLKERNLRFEQERYGFRREIQSEVGGMRTDVCDLKMQVEQIEQKVKND